VWEKGGKEIKGYRGVIKLITWRRRGEGMHYY
jgi:hypothetical protein